MSAGSSAAAIPCPTRSAPSSPTASQTEPGPVDSPECGTLCRPAARAAAKCDANCARGTPTSGPGKVTHMHAWLDRLGQPFGSFGRSHFYSDSHNDIPLLSIVSHPVATNPSAALASHAQQQGWPTIQLFND